jgi:arylsulfatase A-like enzyme
VPLDDDSPTLAGLAASAGYRTGTVVPYVFFRPEAGTTRGFQDIDITPYRERNYSNDGITSDLLTERALRWFDGLDRGQPWLFWMHYIDPHSPYHAYGEVQPTAPAKARYLSEFRRVDDALDDLFAGLDERGLLDDAVLILAADHGEEFGEHGGRYHGTTVFEEQARVPLLFRVPGVAPRRVSGIASLVDVTPTVVDLLGLSTEATFDGQSLWDTIRGEPLAPRPVLSLSTLHGRRAAIIDGDLKLIADMTDRTLALFDLSRDPRERRNLADERPEEVRRLLCKLQASGIIELDGR